MMAQPRCGVKDFFNDDDDYKLYPGLNCHTYLLKTFTPEELVLLLLLMMSFVNTAGTWPNKTATWTVLSYSTDLPSDLQLGQMVRAFKEWDDVSIQ
jgi:hypothetical protein